MVTIIKDNWLIIYLMDQAFTIIKTETLMKVNSKTEWNTAKENYFTKIKKNMKDHGMKIKLLEKE